MSRDAVCGLSQPWLSLVLRKLEAKTSTSFDSLIHKSRTNRLSLLDKVNTLLQILRAAERLDNNRLVLLPNEPSECMHQEARHELHGPRVGYEAEDLS